MQINTNIQANLTKDESEVFSTIKQVIEKYTPSTVAYAVGGWTRDKLLGIPSDDIDIMLSNISGEDFAQMVTKHLGIKDAHTIKSNPEKSKHITTSKAYIPLSSGKIQEIDFAQARSEVYKEDSRIPDIKPATPQEDATRRDLTINAIFYNINKNKLEDFTGNGIKDLISNTIRTPLDPLKTFSDDPLRIFRVIRFSAKYNGKIDPETYQAMTNPQLREEIKQKISKERIGQEFIKMMKNPNPQIAIELLKNTNLLQDIISEALKGTQYEGKLAELDMSQQNPHHKLTLWGHTMEVVKSIIDKYKDAEPETRITMILAALMHDLGKLYKDIWGESKSFPGSRSFHGHEDESSKMTDLIFRYLKIEPYIQQVSTLAKEHMRPHRFTERAQGGSRAMRKFIRQMGEQSLNWLDVFNLSVADAYAKDVIKDPSIVEQYNNLETKLREALATLKPISEKSTIKPILDGNEIMTVLEFNNRGIKPGPIMKEMTEFIKELRDENPDITKEDAIKLLKEKYEPTLPPIKQAQEKQENKKDEKEPEKDTTCPMQLLGRKIIEINDLFNEKKYYEISSIASQLKEEYGNDENITRFIAATTFSLLIKGGQEYRNNETIDYLFINAEKNFFDYVLCSYVLGILLLIDTPTEDKTIKEIGERVITMSPDLVKKIFNMLPKEIYRKDLKKKLEKKL